MKMGKVQKESNIPNLDMVSSKQDLFVNQVYHKDKGESWRDKQGMISLSI